MDYFYKKEESMDRNILNQYKKPEEKLILSKIMDKIEFCKIRNQIQVTHFLDLAQQQLVTKFLKSQKQENYLLFGGFETAERAMLLFYPDKLEPFIKQKQINFNEWLKVIRITLPNEMAGQYEHRNYLGALMKLGIKREMIGDILVDKKGADILLHCDSLSFLLANLPSLTRFQKAKIEEISLQEIRKIEVKREEFSITVSSMRLDNVVAELAKCSRNKATELLMQERVLVNFEIITKATKEIKPNDRITIRGRGRFFIKEVIGNTKKGKIFIKIEK